MNTVLGWMVLAACALTPLRAQDPFEIHVYEYEPMKLGQFTVEQHLNFVGRGSREAEGTLAPTNHQTHMTFEVTAGVAEWFSIGAMQLNAVQPGAGFGYAGWRLLPHFYAPAKWGLPLDAGLVVEFSFQKTAYEENSRRVEIRPILEKRAGRWQFDFNPVFERALHGPGTRAGWNFEPAARAAFRADKGITPSLEYYSAWGSLPGFSRWNEQVHLLFPGMDFRLRENLLWSTGIGVAATPAGNQLVLKSRLEIEFGGKS